MRHDIVRRDLCAVIDAIVEVAPDLKDALTSARSSASFTAPEEMGRVWRKTAHILTRDAAEHPQRERIAAIFFSGGVS